MIYTAQQFADDAGISVELAKKILDMLYEKELGAEDLNCMIWRIRDWVIKNKLPDLIAAVSDEDLQDLLNQMIVERAMYRAPYDVCCAETPEQFAAALSRTEHPTSMRFFAEMKFSEGKKKAGDIVTIQIMRTGVWQHQLYGEVKVTEETLQEVKKNFDENVRGVQLAVDENHEDNHAALAWYKEVFFEGDDTNNLFARVELTQAGADKVNDGSYKYFSPEIAFMWVDEETGTTHTNLLIGGAFTNRPFFKGMKPLQLNDSASAAGQGTPASGMTFFIFSTPDRMKKYLELVAKFASLSSLSKAQRDELQAAWLALPEAARQKEKLAEAFTDLCSRFTEGDGGESGAAAPVVKTPEELEAERIANGGEPAPVVDPKPELDAEGNPIPKEAAGTQAEAGNLQASELSDMPGVVFNEELGTVEITDSAAFIGAFKSIQQNVSKLQKDMKFAEITKKCEALRLTKNNPKGVLTPQNFAEVRDFAVSLNDAQQVKFLALVGKFKSIGGVIGSAVKPAVPAAVVVAELNESNEMVKHYMTMFGQTKEAAIESAGRFYENKAKAAAKQR